MDSVLNTIQKVIGSSRKDEDLRELSAVLGEKPALMIDKFPLEDYLFRQSGVQVTVDKRVGQISSLFLHLRTGMTSSGMASPYTHGLPAGISADDSIEDVKGKLGRISYEERRIPDSEGADRWIEVTGLPQHLRMIFSADGTTMHSLSIRIPGGL